MLPHYELGLQSQKHDTYHQASRVRAKNINVKNFRPNKNLNTTPASRPREKENLNTTRARQPAGPEAEYLFFFRGPAGGGRVKILFSRGRLAGGRVNILFAQPAGWGSC